MKAEHSVRTAPQYETEDDCAVCGFDGRLVYYDGDRFCPWCGHVPGPDSGVEREHPWHEWVTERRENEDYSGWHGEERVKFVGGFLGPWDFGEDEYLVG